MNKLALSALMIGGLFQATGCIITTDDGGPVGSFDVAWISSAECPADSTAEILSQDIFTQELFTDIHDCTAGTGFALDLPLGDYDVWVEITDASGALVYAQSNSVAASIDIDGQVVAVDVGIDSGSFGLTWNMIDAVGAPLSCAEVGGSGVDIVATQASTAVIFADVFNCDAGQGVSNPAYMGEYTLVVDVLDDQDATLATSVARDETLSVPDAVVDLGNFDFLF